MTAPEDQNGLREALERAEAERDAAIEKANELEAWCDRVAVLIKRQQGWQTYGQWLEADADAAMAHEIADQRAKVKAFRAEITRLKEGMEAAVGALKLAEDVMSRSPFSTMRVWPNGTGSQEGITTIRTALATLSPKEHPHG